MPNRLSPEAKERPKRTIQAAGILAENARAIANLCADADAGEIVVVVLSANLDFNAWTMGIGNLHEHLSRLPPGGWSMTFAPKTTVEQVRARCESLAGLARRRLETMERWANRQQLQR